MTDPLPASSSPSLQVAVIYNPEDKDKQADILLTDAGIAETAETIAQSLRQCGYNTTTYAVSEKNLYYLKRKKADVFFNVCEADGLYMRVVRQLAKYGRMFTGPGPEVMTRTVDKVSTKVVFDEIGVPTPAWQAFHSGKEKLNTELHFPLIVKPANTDCSIGITQHSVVHNVEQLYERIKETRHTYKQTVLVEEFIPGRELHCTIVGNGENAVALPLAELQLTEVDTDDNFIFDYEAKWVQDSPRYKNRFVSPAPSVNEKATQKIQEQALRAFHALEMKDYARFDVRYNTATGQWFFLETNANPSIVNSEEEATVTSAFAQGMRYEEFVQNIVESCAQRHLASVA